MHNGPANAPAAACDQRNFPLQSQIHMRSFPGSTNEQDMHIHHIRPGWPCDQEIVQGVKKVVRIIAA